MAETGAVAALPPAQIPPQAIPPETLNRIPLNIAQEFGAVFFAETPTELHLGVLHPDLLKDHVDQALVTLQQQVGKKIILFLISDSDFKNVIKQYKPIVNPASTPVVAPTPTLTDMRAPTYKIGSEVSDKLLATMPLAYAHEKHLITVDSVGDDEYWLATDKENTTQQIVVDLMARRNRIKLHVVAVPRAEFQRLLIIREAIDDREQNPPLPAPETTIGSATDRVVPAKSDDLISPTQQGKIITGEVEKEGVAGLLQKASSLFGSRPEDNATQPVTPAKPLQPQVPVKDAPLGEEKKLSVPIVSEPEKPEPEKTVPSIRSIGIAKETENISDSLVGAEVEKIFRRPVTDIKQLQVIVRQGSIPRILAGIINYAVEQRASDIHIEPYGDELLIRYRVDGQLGEVIKLPMEIHPAMVSRVKILSKLKLDEQRIPQDGRFDVVVAGDKAIDIRVSTLPTVHGEKAVMRLLDKSEGIYSLEKLGLSGDGLNRLLDAIKQPYGVILATGPTGSGKTTTLYAILQRVATSKVNVITLEDPVEYEMKGINQSQIKPKVGFTFAEGLRSVLRQDPNIIMVGEVRDSETASMVTHSALTGHLVLSTLHTNNAAGALPRLMNMGIEPFLITSAMNAIVGQRLVRKLCENCREKVSLPDTVRREIDLELEKIKKFNPKEAERIPQTIEFYRPLEGCKDCTSGYRGRVGLYEVLRMSDTIEELAVKKAPAVDIERVAVEAGMITMKQDGILKVLEGATTLDEILRETSDR